VGESWGLSPLGPMPLFRSHRKLEVTGVGGNPKPDTTLSGPDGIAKLTRGQLGRKKMGRGLGR
jgi:hypothetical protein